MYLLLLSILFSGIIIWFMIPKIRTRNQNVSMGKEWLALLRSHSHFSAKETGYPVELDFLYAEPMDENLKRLRETFDLETIAGQGSEIDRIINLMTWVYQLAGHANMPEFPSERNAFTLIHMAKIERKQINCYMKTVILNEVYLSMGFHSRHTHLLPHSHEDQESHFVTSVYSHELGTWILMDPDFGTYVTDEKNTLLGVREIRQRLIADAPMKTIHPGRNRFKTAWTNLTNFVEGADYFWFLSEFIFKIRCPRVSTFGQDNAPSREYFELNPDGYNEHLLQEAKVTARGNKIFYINDENMFWFEAN